MQRLLAVAMAAAFSLSACGEKKPQVIIDPPPPSNTAPVDQAAPPAPAVVNTAADPAAPATAAPAAKTAASAGAPRRKPGLWQLTANNGETTTVTTLCVTEASEGRLNAFDTRRLAGGPPAGGGQGARRPDGDGSQSRGPRVGGPAPCEPRITKTGAGWQGRATCTREMGEGAMQIAVDEALSGDLQSKYTLKSRRTVSGAPAPQMNRTVNLTVEGVYKGPCPAGQSGGDLVVGGRTVSLLDRN